MGSTGVFSFHGMGGSAKRVPTKAKPVPGVQEGVFGRKLGVLDASALVRLMPADRDTREGGFRDALESMALALISQGVSLATINSAAEEVLDAYGNND